MTLQVIPSQAQGVLELRLLGVGEVRLGGLVLEVGHRKTLALLAFLALEGQSTRSALTSIFWSDNTEEAARRNLRRELHRLREAGLRDHLEASSDHLRLLGLATTDVQQFENLVTQGHLEAALLLFRGELLAGLRLENAPEFEAWLESKREGLAAALRRAQLELAERLETKGDWQAALALHQKVLKSDWLQERQHHEVMRLHYLLGQREAALAQFEQCRTMLQQELGLEPLPSTLQLVQQIRAAQSLEPSVAVQLVATQQLSVPLIGRESEMNALYSSSKVFTLLLGEAGIGKSYLLENFAPTALRLCFAANSSQTPLYVIAETIRLALHNPEAQEKFEALEPIWQLEAARLVPELITHQSSQPQERSLLLEGLARVFECLTNQILIFEDLHWADSASLELITHLVQRSTRASKLRFVASARAEELSFEAQQMLEALTKSNFVQTISLEPLNQTQVGQLLSSLGANIPASFVSQLFAVTAGNPFFILETIRFLFEQGELEEIPNHPLPIPPSVRQAVLQRLQRLGSKAVRLLETAALTEDGFGLEEIQPATALNEWEGVEGLEQAVHAQILKRLETGFGFTHDLTRQALETTLSAERKRLIHSKLAVSLEQQKANPSRIATHLERANKPLEAVPWRKVAAEHAERVYAHALALEQYQKALEHQPSNRIKLEILQARLGIWEKLGQHSAWQTDLVQLESIAVQLGESNTLEFAKARFAIAQNQPEIALQCAEQILANTPDHATRAEAHHWAGIALLRQSQLEKARSHFQDALKLLPNQATLHGQILMQLFQVEFDAGHTEAAKTHLRQALQHNQISKNQLDEIQILNHQGRIALNEGNNEIAAEIFETAMQKVMPMNHPTLERTILMGLATAYARNLRLNEALSLLERALHLAEITDAITAKGGIYHTIGAIHRRRLDYGQTLKHYLYSLDVAEQLQQHPARIFRNLTLADLYLDMGDDITAQVHLEQAANIMKQTGVKTEIEWLKIMQARQKRQVGQVKTARQALEGQEPQNRFDRVIWLTELALIRLADKDYDSVLQLLEGEDAPDNTLSMLLGIRLQAMAALKQPLESELMQIHALINAGNLMQIFSLHANVVLTRVYHQTGKTELSEQHRVKALALVQHAASQLEDYPLQRQAWLVQYAEVSRII